MTKFDINGKSAILGTIMLLKEKKIELIDKRASMLIPLVIRDIWYRSSAIRMSGSIREMDEVSAANAKSRKKTNPQRACNEPNWPNANGRMLKTRSGP